VITKRTFLVHINRAGESMTVALNPDGTSLYLPVGERSKTNENKDHVQPPLPENFSGLSGRKREALPSALLNMEAW